MVDVRQQPSSKTPNNRQVSLRNSALGLLARREHSRHELQQKLIQKLPVDGAVEGDRDAIPALLDRLTEQGLLSDERFTEAYVNMRARKGYGPTRIAIELAEKGIVDELAQVYLERSDWRALLAETWRKKFNKLPVDYPEKARQMRFLHFRGYDTEAIQQLFEEL